MSRPEARRVALAAQGLAAPRPSGRVDRRHLRRVLGHVGLLQIDSVNVLVRSQELPLFARLGPHPRTLIDDAVRDGELYEYWVHEASLVPTADHHLFRWRSQRPIPWPGLRRELERLGSYVDEVHRRVRDEGPLVASDLGARVGTKGPWWDYDDGKLALEALFYLGRVTATRRPHDFARVYDLPERAIAAAHLQRPDVPFEEAHKILLERAARYHGVGTLKDLADYHRLALTPSKRALGELVSEGRLLPVEVDGWDQPAYLHPEARRPRRVESRALLSPFDPVVWNRERALRLFDFHYRIEIYTPAPRRRYGYYVLPFVLGDQVVGRVDLKADRARGELLVQSAWGEDDVDESHVSAAMLEEISLMAAWLELECVRVVGGGNLGPTMRRRTRS